jgi:protein ImuB
MPRMLVVWCPDWPMVAAGAPPDVPAAVVHANRVLACSPAARAEGVHPGLRRREAQGRCPELELLAHDPARDARAFEPVLVAVEGLTPWVEVLRPGECAFPARGAARYHGGEPALAVTVTAAVHAALGGRGGCQVGIADGTFAAGLAARHQAIVPPGGSRAFLAPHPVAALDRPDLADLLVRLGLRTLGDLAALPRADLATRFGPEGARASRLASGLDEQPRGARRPPPDLRVAAELDPPADRVDLAAFAAKTLADELVARLDRLGLACTRLRIEAETDQGETLSRVWRSDPITPMPRRSASSPDPVPRSPGLGAGLPGPAGTSGPAGTTRRGSTDPSGRLAAAMAERARWQLDGWLTGRTGRPPGALTRLVLAPDEVVPDRGRQLGFWGGESEADQRAARAVARIQGLLGPEAVSTARLRGGRDPADRVTFTPAPDTPTDPLPSPLPNSPGRALPRAAGTLGRGLPGPAGTPGGALPGLAGTPGQGMPSPAGAPGRALPGRAGAVDRALSDSSGIPDGDLPGAPGHGPGGATGGFPGHGPTGTPGGPGQGTVGGPGAVPWPGQVPAPAPAIVYAEPLPAEVVDAAGATVTVDGRGLLGSLPSRLRLRGRSWSPITAWAGPWLVDERWWDPAAHRRLVRLQATTDQGAAYLLRLAGGRWWVEAAYD